MSLDMSEDPYIMEEEDPSKSRALESSLWEIQVCHPKMSTWLCFGSLPPLLLPLHVLAVDSPSPLWECRWMSVTLDLLDYLLFVLLFQSLQNHYHPDVAKAAAVLNQSLSEMEDDISGLLELSAYEVMLLCLCEWLEPEERKFWMQQPCPVHLPCCWGGSYTALVTQNQGKPGKWAVK